MSKVIFEPDDGGIQEFLKSSEVQSMLEDRAKGTEKLDGVAIEVRVGRRRAKVNVVTETFEAANRARKTNDILKLLR